MILSAGVGEMVVKKLARKKTTCAAYGPRLVFQSTNCTTPVCGCLQRREKGNFKNDTSDERKRHSWALLLSKVAVASSYR
jgi:hypothetical protein